MGFIHIRSVIRSVSKPSSQIPQCTSPMSHTCAHFCYKIVHCRTFVWCIVVFFRCVYIILVYLSFLFFILFIFFYFFQVSFRNLISIHCRPVLTHHYDDVIMSAVASQITSLTVVYSTVYSCTDQRKHQSSASLAFVRGIHRGPVNSPHKWPVTRKMIPFDDVIMILQNTIDTP